MAVRAKTGAKQETAFHVWRRNERDFERSLAELSGVERSLGNSTLRNWAKQFGWHARADELDKKEREAREKREEEERERESRQKSERLLLLENRLIEIFVALSDRIQQVIEKKEFKEISEINPSLRLLLEYLKELRESGNVEGVEIIIKKLGDNISMDDL